MTLAFLKDYADGLAQAAVQNVKPSQDCILSCQAYLSKNMLENLAKQLTDNIDRVEIKNLSSKALQKSLINQIF